MTSARDADAGSGVDVRILYNRLELSDAARLAELEYEASMVRDVELTLRPEPGAFDRAHLCRVHRRLFGDVYPWAGTLRTCQLARTAPFAHPAFLAEQADELFGTLGRERHLRDLPRQEFVERLTYYLAEVNALHPFREGNGRAQRAFFRHLSAEAGWRLRWELVGRERNDDASRRSLAGDLRDLWGVIDEITTPM